MAGSYTVALVGFAQQESGTFESFFRLAARRPPAYTVQDEVMDAQLLIVNADNLQAVHLVRHAELAGQVLLVGNSDAGTGWPLQRKPIKLVAVLTALDGLVGVAKAPAPAVTPQVAASHAPPVPSRQGADRAFAATQPYDSRQVPLTPALPARRKAPDTEFPPTRPMEDDPKPVVEAAPEPRPVMRTEEQYTENSRQRARPGVMGMTDFGGLEDLPMPVAKPRERVTRSPRSRIGEKQAAAPQAPKGDILLVAENLVEGRILLKRFKRYGLAVDWSREPKQAVSMIKAHVYRAVVVDRLTGTPDAYQVCRTAKQGKLPNGNAPLVMMFAPSAGSMDRIKASLAGCDAYLSRSVGESELYKVLAKNRLVDLDGFEATNVSF